MPQAKKTAGKKISLSNQLYRSRTERMIGGVCGGVAEYFNVDITLIRIIWVISIFAQGLGVVAYIAGLIIIPDNPNSSTTQVKKSKAAENTMLIIGAVIIALGVALLFRVQVFNFPYFRLFYYHRFFRIDLLWPVAIIIVGVLIIYFVIKKDKEAADTARGKPKPAKEQKIYRSSDDKMIGGVCSGLAKYLKIDVTFVRLGWVIFSFYTVFAVGVIAYVAMLILVPQEE